MSLLRMSVLSLLLWSVCLSAVHAWQSCPNPANYDSQPPVRVTVPGYVGIAAMAKSASKIANAQTLIGDYRPVDLLGWTLSSSACTSSSDDEAPCGAHRVYVPAANVALREPLVVFLPGSSMTPRNHDLVLKTAAYAGYRSIGLSYDSTNNVDSLCSTGGIHWFCGIDDCYAPKRDEIILGNDTSGQIEIERADSVIERLFTLLSQLYVDDMADGVNDFGWDAYVSPVNAVPVPIRASNINWDQIIIAGFSQGAGHAARISQQYLVHGTVMIDGPGDMCYTLWPFELVPAQWMDGTDASAGRPRYGALHATWSEVFDLADGEVPPTWEAMGLPANGLVNIDDTDDDVPGRPGRIGLIIDIDLPRLTPPAPAMSTSQAPAGTSGVPAECLQIPAAGLPDDISQKHGSMADDRCMPTNVTDGVLASSPRDAHLFQHYLRRFCYACEQGVCP